MCFLEKTALSLEECAARKFHQSKSRVFTVATYTDRFRSSLIALISIFLRPIMATVRLKMGYTVNVGFSGPRNKFYDSRFDTKHGGRWWRGYRD
jgi:hypothetical protein